MKFKIGDRVYYDSGGDACGGVIYGIDVKQSAEIHRLGSTFSEKHIPIKTKIVYKLYAIDQITELEHYNEFEESELYGCISDVDAIIDSGKEETYNCINARIKLLKDIVTDNWDNDKNEPSDFGKLSKLLQENRIVDNMHVGQQSSFFEDGVDGKLKILEWFLGSFVNIIENQGFIAMNSWLNMKRDHIDNL